MSEPHYVDEPLSELAIFETANPDKRFWLFDDDCQMRTAGFLQVYKGSYNEIGQVVRIEGRLLGYRPRSV